MEAVERNETDHEKPWRSLSLQREWQSILSLRGKKKMEAILSSDHPKEIFQSLHEEEAYLTIKEIGEQDALPLLSLMSHEQIQYLLDLELWRGYEFNPEKVDHWLPLILSCDEETKKQWLSSIDFDTLLLLLKKNIRIHTNGEESFLSGSIEDIFTLDGFYFIEVLRPTLRTQIDQLLKTLADLDFQFYLRLMDQVQWEIEAELEERALHFREARLADKGFPNMEEAQSVYQYLTPQRLKERLEEQVIHLSEIPEDGSIHSFPLALKDENLFFSICLRELEEGPLLDRIKMELATLANQVLMADLPETIDLATFQKSLVKTGAYLSIGLEILSEGRPEQSKGWLESIPLKFLFQVGFGATLDLKWKAERLWKKGWFSEKQIPLDFLGYPWEERMRGVLKKRPLLFTEIPEFGYREFRSLKEIHLIQKEIEKSNLLVKILSNLPPFSYSEGLQWKTVLLNAFLLDRTNTFSSTRFMTLEEIISLRNQLQKEKGDLKNTFLQWMKARVDEMSENEAILLEEMTVLILEEIHP